MFRARARGAELFGKNSQRARFLICERKSARIFEARDDVRGVRVCMCVGNPLVFWVSIKCVLYGEWMAGIRVMLRRFEVGKIVSWLLV